MGPDSGIATTIFLTELILIMDSIIRTEDDHLIDGHINSPTEVKKNQSNNGNYSNQNGTWRSNGNFSRSPPGQGRDFSRGNAFRQRQSTQTRKSPFRRSDDNPITSSSSFEQKFPKSNI